MKQGSNQATLIMSLMIRISQSWNCGHVKVADFSDRMVFEFFDGE